MGLDLAGNRALARLSDRAKLHHPLHSMKNFGRNLSLALALGAAGFLAGCTSYRSSMATPRTVNASDFEVVETSTKRLLTTQEILQLKIAVAKYLDKEGAVASGDYYVKVFLGPNQDGVPADWVVVRFTRDRDTRFSLLASYPAYTPGYQSYAAYDYYPYGYDHFSRISFQYYNDPYYGSGYYFPPRRHNHDHDRDRDRGRDRDHDKDRDGDNPRTGDRPRFKPIDPVGSPPQVTRTRGEGNRGDDNSSGRSQRPRGDNRPPRDATSAPPPDRPPAATRHSGGGHATRSDLHRRQDNPAPSSSAQPIRTSSQSAPRTESVRTESTRSEPSIRTSSQSAPSDSAPARSESSSSSSQSQRESNESASQRQRLE